MDVENPDWHAQHVTLQSLSLVGALERAGMPELAAEARSLHVRVFDAIDAVVEPEWVGAVWWAKKREQRDAFVELDAPAK